MIERHIVRKSKRENRTLPQNIAEQLQDCLEELDFADCNIVFSWLFDRGSSVLNAGVFFTGHIVVNAEWAANLLLYPDKETKDTFRQTIGHELTHLENDYVFWEYFTRDKKFVSWVNEVHADFGSAVKCLDADRSRLVAALSYKRMHKGKKDRDFMEHPSWRRRCAYAETYNFDSALIEKIAGEIGCKNTRLIEKICKHYEQDIILR